MFPKLQNFNVCLRVPWKVSVWGKTVIIMRSQSPRLELEGPTKSVLEACRDRPVDDGPGSRGGRVSGF